MTAAAPNPLWYIDRSSGEVTLLLMTAVVILGITRAVSPSSAPVVIEGVHRRIALLTIAFGGLHALAAIVDPYANLGPLDAVVPFVSAYRPFWLGLGVLSGYLYLAAALSSWPARRLGRRTWRWLHRSMYAVWAIAIVHSLGTGSDARNELFLVLNVVAVVGVLVAFLGYRVYVETSPITPWRALAGVAGLAAVAAIAVWAVNGPLQTGWARAAGTPPGLLKTP